MEVSQDSQNSIVFESSSQDPSNSGIVFAACISSGDSVGTGNQAEGKQRGTQGILAESQNWLLRTPNLVFPQFSMASETEKKNIFSRSAEDKINLDTLQ